MKLTILFLLLINCVPGKIKPNPSDPSEGVGGFLNALRFLSLNAVTITAYRFAGSGDGSSVDGKGTSASFNSPLGTTEFEGNYYVVESGNVIRKVDSDANVTTLSGVLNYPCDSCGTFNSPTGIAVDGSGNIYIADTNNHKIRKISSSGVLSTFAGSGSAGSTNGTGTAAQFSYPRAMTIDSSGNLFVKQGNGNNDCFIKKITPGGVVSTFFGNGNCSYDIANQTIGFVDSTNSTGDQMNMDSNNNIYTKDSFSGIYKIDSNGNMTKIYNTGVYGLALDSSQNIIFTTVSKIGKLDTTSLQESTLYNYSTSCSSYSISLQSTSNLCGNGTFKGITLSNSGTYILNSTYTVTLLYPGSSQFRLLNLPQTPLLIDGATPNFKSVTYLTTKGGKSYIADSNAIRVLENETVSTIAGGEDAGNQDGGLNLSQYSFTLKGIGKDQAGRLLYLKSSISGYYLDSATQRFKQGNILATNSDSKGNKYYSSGNQIRKTDANGTDTLLAGTTQLGSTDGSLQNARFNTPDLVNVNSRDEIIIQELKTKKSRKINADQSIVSSKSISSNVYIFNSTGTVSLNTIRDTRGNIFYSYSNTSTNTLARTNSSLDSSIFNISGIT